MDTIFYLGDKNLQIPTFLEKLGYSVLGASDSNPVTEVVTKCNLDLILIDGRVTSDLVDLCAFFRSQESTRSVPIVCVSPPDQQVVDQLIVHDRLELIPSSFSVGTLASRIATQLRLRKNAGKDDALGSLAEMNAALRDHNARFQKDLEEARAIQQSLLPQKLPRDPRFQISVSYHPLEQVGGDWYFVDQHRDTGELELHIADVSGHGLPAAFLASMAKLAMIAAEQRRPDHLLAKMNHYLQPQLPLGRFVTTGHVLYNPDSGDLQWARAGHGPALLRRAATGKVSQLFGDGFPIGFVEGSQYELVRDRLDPGDALILYTDGLTEAQNRDMEQFGLERLSEAFSQLSASLSAAQMITEIIELFALFLDDRLLKDDVTLLLLKREL
jgi:serine phosphatase RsbU (regulator of sigma subunit)